MAIVDNKIFIDLFKRSELKQSELARELGNTPTIVSLWVNNKKKVPSSIVAYMRQKVALKEAFEINLNNGESL